MMAKRYPNSTFVGVDLSVEAIESAKKVGGLIAIVTDLLEGS